MRITFSPRRCGNFHTLLYDRGHLVTKTKSFKVNRIPPKLHNAIMIRDHNLYPLLPHRLLQLTLLNNNTHHGTVMHTPVQSQYPEDCGDNGTNRDLVDVYESREYSSLRGPMKVARIRPIYNNCPNKQPKLLYNNSSMVQSLLFMGSIDFSWYDKTGKCNIEAMQTGDIAYLRHGALYSFTCSEPLLPRTFVMSISYATSRNASTTAGCDDEVGDEKVHIRRRYKAVLNRLKARELINDEVLQDELHHRYSISPERCRQLIHTGIVPTLHERYAICSILRVPPCALDVCEKSQSALVVSVKDKATHSNWRYDYCSELGDVAMSSIRHNGEEKIGILSLNRLTDRPDIKTFKFYVTSTTPIPVIETDMHQIIFNYGTCPIIVQHCQKEIRIDTGDSISVEPMVPFTLAVTQKLDVGLLYVARTV